MTCRVPRLHCGHERLSADFCCWFSSSLLSGVVALRVKPTKGEGLTPGAIGE